MPRPSPPTPTHVEQVLGSYCMALGRAVSGNGGPQAHSLGSGTGTGPYSRYIGQSIGVALQSWGLVVSKARQCYWGVLG